MQLYHVNRGAPGRKDEEINKNLNFGGCLEFRFALRPEGFDLVE